MPIPVQEMLYVDQHQFQLTTSYLKKYTNQHLRITEEGRSVESFECLFLVFSVIQPENVFLCPKCITAFFTKTTFLLLPVSVALVCLLLKYHKDRVLLALYNNVLLFSDISIKCCLCFSSS